MLNTRKNYVSLYTMFRTFLQLCLRLLSHPNDGGVLCAPKNHLHHINCLSSHQPTLQREEGDVVGFLRRVAQKEKISRNLSALFWWHGNMEKNCVYDNEAVYKFLCNYVYRKISYHCQVDHWCKSRVLFGTGFRLRNDLFDFGSSLEGEVPLVFFIRFLFSPFAAS